jgi:hypothetical protein
MRIPVAAVLRDSQAYVRSAETGMGIHEMKGSLLQEDLDTWLPFVDWLEARSRPALAVADADAAAVTPESPQASQPPKTTDPVSAILS